MKFPHLQARAAQRETVDVFRGYNHNLRIGAGEFYDMKNMTSDSFPVLSPRGRRGGYARPASPQGLIARDAVCYVDGTGFVIGETRVELGLSADAADCPKQLKSMGVYVIILPDKKYVNTMDPTDFGSIEASFTTRQDVTFTLCTADGEACAGAAASDTPPENPGNLDYWIDTSSRPHTLKRYAQASGMWADIADTYVKIESPGIGAAFGQYDGVTISGIQIEQLRDLNATQVLWARGDDYLVVTGILDGAVTQAAEAGSVTVRRTMPDMDYITQSDNRLWGCRYGRTKDGGTVNELYACKLGDFKNWNCFMGLATDSYAASCGTDGPFTGAVTHLGYPLFFKENWVHKVYGNAPENYRVQTTACRGVQKGCHGSLAIVNETLYYKSPSGICAYDGSLPREVGSCLGREAYGGAVGCAHGNKYYVSMANARGEWSLFVYDTARDMWHREDNLHALDFCSFRGELYCVEAEGRNILTLLGSGEAWEEAVSWMAETGELGLSAPDSKYVSRLTLRLLLEPGSELNLYIRYDDTGEWAPVCHIRGTGLRSFSIPIRPRRCDHLKLRMEGTGGGRIYSITKTIMNSEF